MREQLRNIETLQDDGELFVFRTVRDGEPLLVVRPVLSLSTVKSAAENLLVIVDDLLDFDKIEAGKIELAAERFSLRKAVRDCVRALALRAHRKGLDLIYDVSLDVPDKSSVTRLGAPQTANSAFRASSLRSSGWRSHCMRAEENTEVEHT